MAINPDFSDLLRAFNAAEVRYLVVGAYAVTFHAQPRFTKDLDLWWPRRVESRYGDCAVRLISREDLIRNKRAAGRPQDLIDLRALEDESAGE